MALTAQHRLRPSTAVKASTSADGLVLLDIDGGLVLSANIVGARIWQLVEQQHTPAEIARRLIDEYDVTEDRARLDVDAFLTDLITRGLAAQEGQP
jgi:hypothetical protein